MEPIDIDQVRIKLDDSWPEALSDGLTLPCYFCEKIPSIDYIVDHDFWKESVPEEAKLGVVCLDCLNERTDGMALYYIKKFQIICSNKTLVLEPKTIYIW